MHFAQLQEEIMRQEHDTMALCRNLAVKAQRADALCVSVVRLDKKERDKVGQIKQMLLI